MRKVIGAGLTLALAACTACNSRFTQADVEKEELDIRTQFEQKGFIVEQVSMVRDADRHMSGYAKMRKPGLILSRIDMTKNCTATMDAGSGRFLWECK
jgi:hypothetical protein